MRHIHSASVALGLVIASAATAQVGGGYDLTWNRIASGGGTSTGAGYALSGTIGQPEAGTVSLGSLALHAGYWGAGGTGAPCYANCDNSTTPPVLNVADFTCFLQRFGASEAYANCDGSTTPPVLNVADFTCFLQEFAGGCP